MKGVDLPNPPSVLYFYANRPIKPILKKLGYRWYEVTKDVKVSILMSDGILVEYYIYSGFRFDSRSGGFAVDMVLPHMGSEAFIICWLIHDVNAYGLYMSFRDTNSMLYSMLDYAGANRFQLVAVKAVGVNDFWYGEPKPGDREYCNVHPQLMFNREIKPHGVL